MKIKRSWVASGIILAGLVLALSSNGCSDDDSKNNDAASHIGKKGEVCQTTKDCAPGLACIPRVVNSTVTTTSGSSSTVITGGGGTCVVGVFNVTQTAKECAATDCETVDDCCTFYGIGTSPACTSQKDYCADAGPTDPTCTYYRQNCVCDAANKYTCDAKGQCQQKCIDDTTCAGRGPTGGSGKCVAGQCSQCATDTDCKIAGDDQTCVNGKCEGPCKGDGDCPGFDRCVAGKCIEGGCQSSRECIAATRNVESTCGTDGKCTYPCQTDLECGNPNGYTFFSCINNQCTYTGCSSDKECRLFLGGTSSTSSSSGGSSSDNRHYVCRDKGLPGNIVRQPF